MRQVEKAEKKKCEAKTPKQKEIAVKYLKKATKELEYALMQNILMEYTFASYLPAS